jgi:redox-sensitive bicupin YhaK (pirin superfamily)
MRMEQQTRTVARIVTPRYVMEGAGVRLRRSFPTQALDYPDPFLLFDHFGSENPADYLAGFPMHPHRGIETVTYMLAGAVTHRDSIGNAGTISGGDIQWMTAGRGILHEEMPEARDGLMFGFQLWVNLPAKDKMIRPRYQEIASSAIPEIGRSDGGRIRIIAGSEDGVNGPVTDIVADPTYLDITLPANAAYRRVCPRGHTVLAYVFEGQASFGAANHEAETTVGASQMVVFNDGDRIDAQTGPQPVRFLLMSGKPSYEPIFRYGPFVMNTREEIEQTLRELRAGVFPPSD